MYFNLILIFCPTSGTCISDFLLKSIALIFRANHGNLVNLFEARNMFCNFLLRQQFSNYDSLRKSLFKNGYDRNFFDYFSMIHS